jgi:hypothetical protein
MSKPYCKTLRHVLPSKRKLDRQNPLHEPKNKDRNLKLTITNKFLKTLLQSSGFFTRNEGKRIVKNQKKPKTALQLQKSN